MISHLTAGFLLIALSGLLRALAVVAWMRGR